jgi:hypothetical protein
MRCGTNATLFLLGKAVPATQPAVRRSPRDNLGKLYSTSPSVALYPQQR